MSKKINIIFFSIIISLFWVFIYPTNAYAVTIQSSYFNIKDTQNIEDEDLTFMNLTFHDYSYTSTQAFGLTGIIVNRSNDTITYTATTDYYDANYNLVARGSNLLTATSGISQFNQMFNLDVLNDHSVNEICYYQLSVEIVDDENLLQNDSINLTPSKMEQYSSYDYVIDEYDVNIVVNENNTFDITETIDAYFNVPKHGIFRTIPLKNTITRLDGTTSTNHTQVTNVNVNQGYMLLKDKNNYQLKIGSLNTTVVEEQTYVIKYTYNLGKDPIKNYDELYYNIIGNEWDTVIGNVTFSITMPKEFDSSKLGFSSGAFGLTDNSKIQYRVSDNQIIGKYNGILDIGEALTVRCELPEGYFVGASLAFNFMNLIYLIPVLFLAISILLWYKFGRDNQVVETVEFYPPKGFNSLEVGFLYRGKVENKDVTSLLIYLANQGYIKISEIKDRNLFSKSKGFKLTKLKEYDGNNINEQIFLDGLFTKKLSTANSSIDKQVEQEVNNNTTEVTSTDLYDNFYMTVDKILFNINNKKNRDVIFEKAASSKTIFIVLMIVATYCLITIPPIFAFGNLSALIVALLFPGIGFTVLFKLVFGETQTVYINGKATYSSLATKLFGIVWGLSFGGIPWLVWVYPALEQDPIYFWSYILGLVCVLGMVICLNYLPKRTPYGNQILGKLRGFKNFLETAEKEKLEMLVTQNPTYFYNILPYTYVLGVSDKWIRKFESISLQAPTWYDGSSDFDTLSFGSFMDSTMSSAESVMSSSASSSSDGSSSSSGGGSSGGGSGGGGGGSW